MSKTILTTTGFILPESGLYCAFEEKDFQLEDFISRSDNYAYKNRLEYFTENNVQFIPSANELYRNYIHDSSFKNLMAMVDLCADVLGKIDVKSFLMMQASNRYMSNISLMFCRDMLLGKLCGTHNYDSVPADSRFVTDRPITRDEGVRRYTNMVHSNLVDPALVNWTDILTPMVTNKSSFVNFFRYIFVDRF